MLCKWFTINGVKVQGLGEKFVAETLNKHNIGWIRSNYIKLKSGKKYTPDFDLGEYYIEVKGMRTMLKALGLLSLLERGNKDWSKSINNESFQKMIEVNNNIKPIIIYINDNTNDHKYNEYWKDIRVKLNEHNIHYVYGKTAFEQELAENFNLSGEIMKMLKPIHIKILDLFKEKFLIEGTCDSNLEIVFDFKGGANGQFILNTIGAKKRNYP